jgi:transcriptional regulator GlxA family with amidase domain
MHSTARSAGADLFSFESYAAGPDRICAQLHVWRAHSASMRVKATSGEASSALRLTDSQPDDSRFTLVANVKKYLSAHLNEKVGLNEMAAAIDASPVSLAETFRIVEGVSLYRYALRMRLMRALELLPQYDDLSRLALDAGFSNHSHFTTAFRQSFGYAPARVRSEMRVRLGA